MDILAHTLWANYGARKANRIIEKKNQKPENISKPMPKLNVALASFFGVFPDFFAFTIPFVMMLWNMIVGHTSFGSFLTRHGPPREGLDIASSLYQYSHSLVIWAVVFIIVWILWKRPRFELLGWALHILIDIPSHAISFYPTPFLFPLSEYRFPYGMQWSNYWYMVINYSLLLIFFIWLTVTQKKKLLNQNK
jgi:hypothetical protein